MSRGRSALALAEPDIDAAPLSPERQKLADAIATVRGLEAGIAEANAAVTQAKQDRSAAERALNDAEETLERAKPRPASTFQRFPEPANAFWSSRAEYEAHEAAEALPPIPIGQARDAVATATDARDSAERAVQYHNDQLKRFQQDLGWRRGMIGDAVRGVLRSDPALAALVAESKRLHTRAAAAAAAVEAAIGSEGVQPDSSIYGYNQPSHYSVDFDGWAASRLWHEAVERLATDATTPLPMVQPA